MVFRRQPTPYWATLLLIFVVSLALTGCNKNKEFIKYLGQWDGEFTPEKVLKGPDTEKDRKRHALKGFLKVYLDNKKYILHLEGEQQKVDLAGNWTVKGEQVTFKPTKLEIKTEGGAEDFDPNRKYLLEEELNKSYAKPITLRLSKDGKRYSGLTVTIAGLEGTHSFAKE